MTITPSTVSRFRVYLVAALAFVAACGGGGGGGTVEPPPPPSAASCASPSAVQLAVGQHLVLDATASSGCLRFPAPGAVEAEYVFGLVSGAGTVSQTGVTSSYAVRAGPQGALATAPPGASPAAPAPAPDVGWPERFHQALRDSERELSARPELHPSPGAARAAAAPPEVGSERTFKVCSNLQCNQFSDVTAVARSVGQKVAVYLDKTVPDFQPLTQADLDDLASTFDEYHHPINLNAFGAESDLDQNGVVVILLTDQVNALTTDCTSGRILGFFWGGDLLTVTGSNRSEIFYGMVPQAQTATCPAAGREAVVARLKPTMIHEFQHMISFNQHALVRGGQSEVTWLNEGLSHLAEELAGRLIPASECPGFPGTNPCRSQYSSGNLLNAWDFLTNTETHFLVSPGNSSGTLEERGAGWLFVRYLVDQFGTDEQGSNVSRGLVQTQLQGATNVSTVTGQPFAVLVGEWFLALYLDDLAGFTPLSPRLQYSSWGFRSVFELNCCNPPDPTKAFSQPFPFTPVNTTSAFPFLRTGTLRGGSGRHFRVLLPSGSGAVDVLLSKTSGGPVFDAAAEARVAVVRLR